MRSDFFESPRGAVAEEELPKREAQIGALSLEYDNKKLSNLKNPDGKLIFEEGTTAIDIHILNRMQNNAGKEEESFSSRLEKSFNQLADYISANRETALKDVQMVRGVTYDLMAKIAERQGFNVEQISIDSLPGRMEFEIVGEYLHTQRAKRNKKIDVFYVLYMPIDDFLNKYSTKKEE